MDWKEEYDKKSISAEEGAARVRSGDRIVCTSGREPLAVGLALAARAGDLNRVELFIPTPTFDFGWFDAGWEEAFDVKVGYVFPGGVASEAMRERRCDFFVGGITLWLWQGLPEEKATDVLLTEVSPPDEHGFCSFGASVYDKRKRVAAAKTVIAEVNPNLIRTCGDNFIHVSEIDFFVEHVSTGRSPGATDLAGRPLQEASTEAKQIAVHVSALIRNGDTLQIGTGGTAEMLPRLGLLDGKADLGWHSEVTAGGIISLVREGVISGCRKTIDKGKAVATAIGGGGKEDMDFVHMNPLFELRDVDYTHDVRTIASLDNMVAINNALTVDLTGQISAESLGHTMHSGAGGLLAFATGATLSRGGRFITVLPSTARGGTVSRIVPSFDPGTIVTVPRTLTDIVVTEYGIARLKGKTQRARARELIAIAHPHFRKDLGKEARQLFWP